ncbi:hypothetical protein BDZ94DRAFT_1256727 [Collybia nuda]|uniref:C2H2-type domain-containing protein n=1 Tax=Collybia nuda TaxID=64659 RepID=A0A9P5YAR4_9AGAR|nr:hypothetical protein BDZ94DRAFT_1256727 [Collybia nuda]
MSWPASYPPRSRSRSPRPRPPYPDVPYAQEQPYRADWDAYDRDRAWAYERDRAGYEYPRRGRSRSPGPDEAGRKRRRSMSPYERDRYEPRPRYNDDYDTHSRGYGHASPRRGHPVQFPPSRRAPPDPHTFDYPASLKQYADWFRFYYPQQATEEDNADKAAEQEAGDGSKPRNGIKSKWEKYKKDFTATQLQTMFDHHRKSPWFAEKYDPASEFQNLRLRVRKDGWKGRLDGFLLELESGKFDPDLNEPESDSKESILNGEGTTSDTNGIAPVVAADDMKGGDDDMQFGVEVDEDPGDNEPSRVETNGKASSDKRNINRGEEISVPPEGNQVMIRTIPPDIGRVKLEEACSKVPGYVYLALGDPLQKRNYYRAGWLRFQDDADMTAVLAELADIKIEGFKLHVTHNLRPFINRIRYAPEVASRPERLQKDLANAKTLAGILEEEAAKLRQFKVPKRSGETNGQPAQLAEDQQEEDTVMAIPETEDDDDLEPKENGSDAVERRIEKVMSEMRDRGLIDVNDDAAYEAKKTEISLDLYIAYLRAAFNTCYYCSVVTDHLEELQRKCLKHSRKTVSKALEDTKSMESETAEKVKKDGDDDMEDSEVAKEEEKEKEREKEKNVKKEGGQRPGERREWKQNDERWLEWLDSKIALLINRDGVDPRAYAGKSYDEELTKAVEPFIKQEDEGKFRCKTCQKLFKATSFVEKHIANKHPELVKQLDDLPYFNNFALDPHRIQPFAHPPPLVGNTSQAPPPQAYGIQGPPAYHGVDYGRPGAYYGGGGFPPGGYPPPYNNGYWDPYAYQGGLPGPYGPPGGYPLPPVMPPRRDEATTARRLGDRIGGFAPGMEGSTLPAAPGLPPKPTAAALDSALVSGNSGGSGNGPGGGGRRRNTGGGGPPPPPPPDAKEDPRAAAGKRVSYHDMDLVAEGDVELSY